MAMRILGEERALLEAYAGWLARSPTGRNPSPGAGNLGRAALGQPTGKRSYLDESVQAETTASKVTTLVRGARTRSLEFFHDSVP